MAYLIQFCTGIAKEAISNCIILPGHEGFRRAKEILYNSFGQSHIIHAYISKVIKGGSMKDELYCNYFSADKYYCVTFDVVDVTIHQISL